jgi:hypothetical protein
MTHYTTYYRSAKKMQQEQDMRDRLNQYSNHNGCFTEQDRKVADEYLAKELLANFIATEL